MEQGKNAAPAFAAGPDHSLSRSAPELLWQRGDAALGLYVHVPFCRAMCSYCTFAKGLYDERQVWTWLDGLQREIQVRSRETWAPRPELTTVFLGGGTPSALTASQWERLKHVLGEAFTTLPGCEFTAEANPESFVAEIASAIRRAGVNRVSFGAQSFDPGELRMLHRLHDEDAIGRAVGVARDTGFTNLSLDLMYGLPNQTVDGFLKSLDRALTLEPDHLSAYCLSLEPGTVLTDEVDAGARPRPDGDRSAEMYERMVSRLDIEGYRAYEISNFARPGKEAAHNLRYWRRENVIALGPSAHALLANHRWANFATLEGWISSYSEPDRAPKPKPVPLEEARFEWIFLRARLMEGLSTDAYAGEWGESFLDRYGSIVSRLVKGGLLEMQGGWIRLTPSARFLSDGVFAEFAP